LENRRPDRRIARTRKALWDALHALFQEHDWNDINILMICTRADVARSSFYVHFNNKAALLDFGFEATEQELESLIRETSKADGHLVCLNWLFDHIAPESKFFRRALQSPANGVVYRRFCRSLEQALKGELGLRNHQVDQSLIAFVIGGVFSMIHDWIEQGCETPPADAKALMLRYANRMLG